MANYKDTLNILKTDFEMKANLNIKEPTIQNKWLTTKVYTNLLLRNKEHKQWILHDGPPYANGNIHVGHALNKIIKDVIIRYHTMKGEYCEYIPGWDAHGMPIEYALSKQGINKNHNLTIAQKRDNCKAFAAQQISIQKQQFARLGLLTDFSKTYVTYDPAYEQQQLMVFVKAIKQKLIYQDLKPVYWSWSSQTALADAEIEYKDVSSPSIYVSFSVQSNKEAIKDNDLLLIWTTTPWTIPANLAIAVNPKFSYLIVAVNKQRYVIAQDCLDRVKTTLGWVDAKVVDTINGKSLEGIKYLHPLTQKTHQIILANYVSNENGTGLVHNAPGFGSDDYFACKAYGIQPYAPIDNACKFTSEINDPGLVGMFYEQANNVIIEKLRSANALIHFTTISHAAAHDWRTKKPVIYRATLQWFIDIKNIQKPILLALKKIKFINKTHREHLVDMIKHRSEWCISRQRYWGVPIPIIYDANQKPLMDLDLIQNIIDIIYKEGSNVWYEKPVEYFLTKNYFNGQTYTKATDTLDVWFDSGTSWQILKANHLNYPADLYFEGNDQYRGWFNASLINAVITNDKAPFKLLLSHGFVLDEQNRKMSKSLGNVIDPMDICNKYGADVLRMWATSSDYQADVSISEKILTQTAEIYRRIRNSLFKFCLANIADFNYLKNKNTEYREVDQFILQQLANNVKKINEAYKSYNFSQVVQIINNHVIELSSWYFDIIKDALYCETPDEPVRRVIQTVLHKILHTYLVLLTPIVPHTCEEAYEVLKISEKSVMFEQWINKLSIKVNHSIVDKINYFLSLRQRIYNELERLRNNKVISKNNQAVVTIHFENIQEFDPITLAQYLNVAKVNIVVVKGDIIIECDNAHLVKCERCWNYYEKSQMHDEHICARCDRVLNKKK